MDKKYYRLTIFNLVILFMFLLKSAGYFQPYLLITVNLIMVVSLFLLVILLEIKVEAIFFISFLFWVLTGGLRIIHFDVWSDRTSVYAYEALFIGLVFLILKEVIFKLNLVRALLKKISKQLKKISFYEKSIFSIKEKDN